MKRPSCPKCGKTMTIGGQTPAGKIRWRCKSRDGKGGEISCYTTTGDGSVVRTQSGRTKAAVKSIEFKRPLSGKKRFIVTTAQNATPVHADFWASLLKCSEHTGAELIVIPIRYKNPTSRWTRSQEGEEVWEKEVRPYLYNQRRHLCDNLVLLADIKTQPTAADPLAGFEAITHGESGILGHTKIALRSIAAPQNKMPKLLLSTGACTVQNYTDTKAGKMGEFHHTLGAVMVELEGGRFHLRHINGSKKDGSFYDLDKLYTPTEVTSGHRAAGIVFGDSHVDFVCPKVEKATFGPGGIVDALNPHELVFNDLLDGYAINPHHKGNIFNAIAKDRSGRGNAREEMLRAIQYVRDRTVGRAGVIVGSNHDDFLRRWIVAADWKQDAENAEFYLETALAMVRATKMTEGGTSYPGAFEYWAKRILPDHIKVLGENSHLIAGIEVGMHGDRGPNGSRGSLRNLRRIGVRSVIGHSHSPGISEGAYQTGTSTHLRLEYNGGPSSWMNSHVVIYPNGKRTHIHVIDGRWRG